MLSSSVLQQACSAFNLREIEGLKHRHQVEEERMVTKKRVVMEACGVLHGGKSVNGSLAIEEEEKRVVTTGPNPLHN
ncbi:hypothetical protein ZIOFF_021401 [Zingiber officinale]|uniref:Uncharacterized protein n=1 Tax=Zingiber officinale TaxID=94328 RepID=A0A8J5LH03_ZINOF|nr:hypothetical protein ZIOFF_021401 [Zingiber officinale]